MIENYYPINGRITVYIYDHHREPLRYIATALTDLDGKVPISNWKMNEARTEITLWIDQDGYGPQLARTFPLEMKEEALPSPGRNFKWSELSACWINMKTGVRVKNV